MKVRYIPHQWIELPWYKFYWIPSAILNLIGNSKEKWQRLKYIKIY